MGKPSPVIWITLLLIVLLPTAAGRFLIDIAGGLLLVFMILPLVLTGVGWLGWRLLQSKMTTCESCGIRSFMNTNQCPICGAAIKNDVATNSNANDSSIPASAATIDIVAKESDIDS